MPRGEATPAWRLDEIIDDLSRHGASTAEHIAARVGCDPRTVRSVLGRLQRRGLVESRQDPASKRAAFIWRLCDETNT